MKKKEWRKKWKCLKFFQHFLSSEEINEEFGNLFDNDFFFAPSKKSKEGGKILKTELLVKIRRDPFKVWELRRRRVSKV